MGKQYTAQQFIDAIPGSGGIISTIAKRVGCNWHTARSYIDDHVTVKAAYDAEREGIIDLAEGVLITNIQLAHKRQKDGGVADTSDVKWLLSRLAKERGYVERQELALIEKELEQMLDALENKLDPETFQQVIKAIANDSH